MCRIWRVMHLTSFDLCGPLTSVYWLKFLDLVTIMTFWSRFVYSLDNKFICSFLVLCLSFYLSLYLYLSLSLLYLYCLLVSGCWYLGEYESSGFTVYSDLGENSPRQQLNQFVLPPACPWNGTERSTTGDCNVTWSYGIRSTGRAWLVSFQTIFYMCVFFCLFLITWLAVSWFDACHVYRLAICWPPATSFPLCINCGKTKMMM